MYDLDDYQVITGKIGSSVKACLVFLICSKTCHEVFTFACFLCDFYTLHNVCVSCMFGYVFAVLREKNEIKANRNKE